MKKYLAVFLSVLLCFGMLSDVALAENDTAQADVIVLDGNGGTYEGKTAVELPIPAEGTLSLDDYRFTKSGAIQVGWEWDRPDGRDDWSCRMSYDPDAYPATEGVTRFRAKWAETPEGTTALVYASPGWFVQENNELSRYLVLSADAPLPAFVKVEDNEEFVDQKVYSWRTEPETVRYIPGECVPSGDDIATLYPDFDPILGRTEVLLTLHDEDEVRAVRSRETNLGNFCADAIYDFFDRGEYAVDAAVLNGGAIRMDIDGYIYEQTLRGASPFDNALCLIEVTGQQLLDALEWSARKVNTGNTAENPGFFSVSGIRFTIDAAVPSTVQTDENGDWAGAPTGAYRVGNVTVHNRSADEYLPLDLSKSYLVAGTDFILKLCGDGYAMFGSGILAESEKTCYDALAGYLATFPPENGVPTVKAGMGYDPYVSDGRITILHQTTAMNPGWEKEDSWSTHYDADFYNKLAAEYPDSYNTPATALKIHTAGELAALAYFTGERMNRTFDGKYISLECDLDIGEYQWYPLFLSKRQAGRDVIVSGDTSLRGTFNGNGHSISNLKIDQPDNSVLGLFGLMMGEVSDLKVTGTIKGDWNLGGVAAISYGEIRNCESSVAIQSAGFCSGGIAGQNIIGLIIGCENNGTITGSRYEGGNVGGIAGWTGSGSIQDSINKGSVSGGYRIGGISGRLQNGGTIAECGNNGAVSGRWDAGGIVGTADHPNDTVEKCVNTGDVSLIQGGTAGYYSAGGIIGSSYGTLRDCINIGSVSATEEETCAGGITGSNRGKVTASVNRGSVSALGMGGAYCGGIVGYNYNGDDVAYIEQCENLGGVSSAKYAGGIAGGATSFGEISNCCNLGCVQNAQYAAGIAGMGNGPMSCCYSVDTISGVQTGDIWATSTFSQIDVTNCYQISENRNLTDADLPGFDFERVWEIIDGKARLRETRGLEKVNSTKVLWLSENEFALYENTMVAAYGENGQMLSVGRADGKVFDLSALSARDATYRTFFLDGQWIPQKANRRDKK